MPTARAFCRWGLESAAHQFEHRVKVLDEVLAVGAEGFEGDAEGSDSSDRERGGVGVVDRIRPA